MMENTVITTSEEETRRLGKKWGKKMVAGSVLALVGDLGSGKTRFVQGLGEGLDLPNSVYVASPTFVLIHEYPGGRLPLYHFDFYRLEREEEMRQLHIEDYFEGNGVCVVEWADRFPKFFPDKTHWLYFSCEGEKKRKISC